ncbi:uncharacterized protein LOC135136941 [Zophobas morio]|uniref:uncharacterized protein LOC135136941 n=1 Tax=Zophobas morio TaxID=2755281 RepID=UPI0030828D71
MKVKHLRDFQRQGVARKSVNMERIKMWAHCYRLNAGINTNMAIESLNKFIKYDELNKKRNNTIEKLLDMLDRVVEDKEWNRIIETERPSTETYQSRIVRDRHRKAENLQNMVEEVGFGEFSVRSNSNKIYKVVYGDRVCRNDCRLMYCVVCQICLHHYKCQCPEFMIKNNLCKHMHMVALFERERYECGLGQTKDTFTDLEEHNYCKRVLMETENKHNYCDMQKNEEVKMLIENNQ